MKQNEVVANRKLIRPNLAELKDSVTTVNRVKRRKQVPPEQTNAENYYYIKQMTGKTPMVVVLEEGETLRGCIEWYDKNCIKLNRDKAPNLLLFKHSIKFMFKEEELRQRRRRRRPPQREQ